MSWASTALDACQTAAGQVPASQSVTACIDAFKASMLNSAATSPQGQQATAAAAALNLRAFMSKNWPWVAGAGVYFLLRRR